MKNFSLLLILTVLLTSCASGYKKINPERLNYVSKNFVNNIALEYKYDLLEKKYKKNETKKEVKLIAVKITNNSDKDIMFGRDFKFIYENNNDVHLMETEKLYKAIKQSPASYLWYLLLSPMQFYSGSTTTNNNGMVETKPANTFPIGLFLGPGLAGGNMLAASSANKNFKNELMQFDLLGKTIKPGETAYGLVGALSTNYDSIKIEVQDQQ